MSLSELGRRLFGTKPERDPGGTRTHVFGDRPEPQRVAITDESESEGLKDFARTLFTKK